MWSFGDDFARNFIIFGVDTSSLSHSMSISQSQEYFFSEKLTEGINDSVGTSQQKFSINFTKAKSENFGNQKLAL